MCNGERHLLREEGNLLRWRTGRKENIDLLGPGYPHPKPFWWDRDLLRFEDDSLARTQPTEDWPYIFSFAPLKLINFFNCMLPSRLLIETLTIFCVHIS